MADLKTLVAILVLAQRELEEAQAHADGNERRKLRRVAARFRRLQKVIRENASKIESRGIDRSALQRYEENLRFGLERLRDSAVPEAESTTEHWVRELDDRCQALEISTVNLLRGGGGAERWP